MREMKSDVINFKSRSLSTDCRLDHLDKIYKKWLGLQTYPKVSTRAHRSTNFKAIRDVRKLSPPRTRGSVFIESRWNDERGRREEGTSPLRVFPRWNENVGSLTLAESRELDGGRTDGWKGGTRVPSGNLRGIEDLVHSYPPTSRPRPAESSLGLNAPIPFPWPLSAYPCTRRYLAHIRTSTGLLYPPRRCLYHLQCPSCRQRGRVPCRYSLSGVQSAAWSTWFLIPAIATTAAREEGASTKRLLSAGPPVPWRQMVQWHISALGQRRVVAAVGLRREMQQRREAASQSILEYRWSRAR